MTEHYVYAYLRSKRTVNGNIGTPYYIGKGFGRRMYEKHRCGTPPDQNNIVLLAENLSDAAAIKQEIKLIAEYGRIDLGTGILRNLTDGGEGVAGRIVTKETRQKISEGHKGKTLSETHKQNLSKALTGRKLPDGVAEKISKANKGMKRSNETKKNISNALKGRKLSKEHIENLRNAKLGTTLSEEHKKNIGKAHKGRVMTAEHKANLKKAWVLRKQKRDHI